MDAFLDTSWCPVCDRQIVPKRYLVPLPPPPPPDAPASPAPPPSSPSSSPKNTSSDATMRQQQRKPAATRTRNAGGLAHGTGRIKPNGTVKRSDNAAKKPSPAASTTSESNSKPAAAVKHRTVIDQSPLPLYCSDECRMKDINNLSGALAYNYNPDRYSPPVPPVPHNSLTGLNEESDSSDSTTSSSVLSRSPPSSDSDVSPASTRPKSQHTESSCLPKHLATLARIYDFPPIPPAPPLLTPASPTSTLSSSPSSHDSYQSGIMMAARRISETLRPAKRSDKDSRADVMQRERERKPIPGWTDGSDAWRADVYSFAKPMDPSTVGKRAEEGIERAYGGFAASPHRSRGVCSTLSDAGVPDLRASTQSLDGGARKAVDELYEKYPLSHSKRSESRVSLQYNPSFTSLCSTSPSAVEDSLLGSRSLPSAGVRRREVKLVKPGAEGKLLVPDVKMVSRSPPSSYASSATTASWYPSSSRRSFGSIPSIRSPLSRVGSELMMGEVQEECESLEDSASEYGWRSESSRCKGKEERERERKEKLLVGGSSETTPTFSCGSESGSLPAPKRPTVETRTWSYDNLLTYPAMPLPVKKVKRKERKMVDGEEKEVEVEVDVCESKRLFLFPGKEVFRG